MRGRNQPHVRVSHFQDIWLRGAECARRVDRQDVAEPQPQARLLLNVPWRLFKARLGPPQGQLGPGQGTHLEKYIKIAPPSVVVEN